MPDCMLQGLEAGLHRQLIFTGLRLGLYKHIQDSLMAGQPKENVVPIHVKIGSAVCTSIIGISLANPSGAHPLPLVPPTSSLPVFLRVLEIV